MAEIIGYKGEELDLLVRQGATFGPVVVRITNPDDTPVDLSDSVFRAQIRKTFDDDAIGATFVCQVTNALAGEVTVTLPATESEKLSAGVNENEELSQHVWDMEAEESGGRVVPYLYGKVQVFREVTR